MTATPAIAAKRTRAIIVSAPGQPHDAAIRDALRSRNWIVSEQFELHAALTELCLLDKGEAARSSWGLPPVESVAVVVDLPAGHAEAQQFIQAVERYAPRASVWIARDGRMRSTSGEPMPDPRQPENCGKEQAAVGIWPESEKKTQSAVVDEPIVATSAAANPPPIPAALTNLMADTDHQPPQPPPFRFSASVGAPGETLADQAFGAAQSVGGAPPLLLVHAEHGLGANASPKSDGCCDDIDGEAEPGLRISRAEIDMLLQIGEPPSAPSADHEGSS